MLYEKAKHISHENSADGHQVIYNHDNQLNLFMQTFHHGLVLQSESLPQTPHHMSLQILLAELHIQQSVHHMHWLQILLTQLNSSHKWPSARRGILRR